MHRYRNLIVGSMVITALLTLFVFVQSNAQAHNVDSQPQTSSPLTIQQLNEHINSNQNNVGAHTIQTTSNTASSNSTESPRVKNVDVQAYILKHPFFSGPLVSGATLKILAVDLITSKNAALRLHGESLGTSDNTLVYYVKLQGPFTTTNIPISPQAKPIPPAKYGIEVFDANTGNLLLWSISSEE